MKTITIILFIASFIAMIISAFYAENAIYTVIFASYFIVNAITLATIRIEEAIGQKIN